MSKATEYAAWIDYVRGGRPMAWPDFDQKLGDIAAELRRLAAIEQERDELRKIGVTTLCSASADMRTTFELWAAQHYGRDDVLVGDTAEMYSRLRKRDGYRAEWLDDAWLGFRAGFHVAAMRKGE